MSVVQSVGLKQRLQMDSLQEAASPLPSFLQLLFLSGGSWAWGGA